MLWPLCKTAQQSLLETRACQELSVILLWHRRTAGARRTAAALNGTGSSAAESIHCWWWGIQDLAQRGLKRLQQAPSVWAARPARVGSSGFEREVTQCHLVLRSSTLKPSVSNTARLVIHSHRSFSDLPSASRKRRDFPRQSNSKIHLLLNLGEKKSPNTHCIFIISSRYTREHLALRGVHTSSTKY